MSSILGILCKKEKARAVSKRFIDVIPRSVTRYLMSESEPWRILVILGLLKRAGRPVVGLDRRTSRK